MVNLAREGYVTDRACRSSLKLDNSEKAKHIPSWFWTCLAPGENPHCHSKGPVLLKGIFYLGNYIALQCVESPTKSYKHVSKKLFCIFHA